MNLEQRVTHERLTRICFIDYDREMALVAVRRNSETGDSEILGVGRLTKIHGTREAEIAVLISDNWQGRGLGKELLSRLLVVAADEKLARCRRHPPRQSRGDAHLRKTGLLAQAFARRRRGAGRIQAVSGARLGLRLRQPPFKSGRG